MTVEDYPLGTSYAPAGPETRYRPGTVGIPLAVPFTGPPTDGYWPAGLAIIDQIGAYYRSTAAGFPGTWTPSGAYVHTGTGVYQGPASSGGDDSTELTTFFNDVVASGGGIALLDGDTYIANNVTANPIYTGSLIVAGAGRDTTTLKASINNTNNVINFQGNVIVQDLTVDGNAQAISGLVISTPNGQSSRIAGLYRVRCRNVSTTASTGPGWVFVIWGQANNNVYNINRAWIEDVEAEGPTSPNYDALAVSGVDTCFVRGLVIDGVNRTPNLYAIRRLIIESLRATNFTSSTGLTIDADVLHTLGSGIVTDASATTTLNMDAKISGSRFEGGLALNKWNQYPHYEFHNCDVPGGVNLEDALGSLTIVGGSYGGGQSAGTTTAASSISDLSSAGTVHGPVTISDALLANHPVDSFNGTTMPLTMTNCRGFLPGRTIIDGQTTSGSAVLTSQTANFTSGDVGRTVQDSSNGNNYIPAGATIASVQSATQATMSANATGTGSADVVVLGPITTSLGLSNLTLTSDSRISGTVGYNPVGSSVTQPAVPAANTNVTNTTGVDCSVAVVGGTGVTVAIGGTSTGLSSGMFRVAAGQTISLGGYSAAPTWEWFGD